MKQNRNLQDFISLFLKFILIMIFPLQFVVGDLSQLLILPTTGFLFTPTYNPVFMTDSIWIIPSFESYLRNFVIGILVALPGMFFNFKLTRAPVSKSYWKRGLWTAFGIFAFAFLIMMYLSINAYSPMGYYNDAYYMLIQSLQFYPTLVFGVFIILPLVQRQAVIIGSPVYLHDYSMKDLESMPKLALTRERILSGIVWGCLCFAPYTIGNNMYYYMGGVPLSGLMMSFYVGSYGGIYEFYQSLIAIAVTSFTTFPLVAFMCFFQFMFVRDIYRYLRKKVSRQRLMGMAVLSTIAPIILSTGLFTSFMFYYMMPSLIPIPILQIVGLLVIKYHRPLADEVDRVWEDDAHRMWWEKPRPQKSPVISTPEKPQRNHDGELITVPVHYLLLSKLRRFNRRGR